MLSPPKLPLRRFTIFVLLSIIITLFFFYSNLCVFHPATQSCPGIISHHDSSASPDDDNPQTPPDPRSPDNDPDIIITADTPSSNINSTLLTEEMGVDDLYQYALRSPRFRNGKDAWKLRKFLSANPWMGREKGRFQQLEEDGKAKGSPPSSTLEPFRRLKRTGLDALGL